MIKYFYIFTTILITCTINATTLNVEIVKLNFKKPVILNITVCSKEFINSNNTGQECYVNQSTLILANTSNFNFTLYNIPEGEWAIFGYVDENLDNKLNTTIFGIPTENVLYTTKVTPFFFKGAPKFNSIKTYVSGGTTKVILINQ